MLNPIMFKFTFNRDNQEVGYAVVVEKTIGAAELVDQTILATMNNPVTIFTDAGSGNSQTDYYDNARVEIYLDANEYLLPLPLDGETIDWNPRDFNGSITAGVSAFYDTVLYEVTPATNPTVEYNATGHKFVLVPQVETPIFTIDSSGRLKAHARIKHELAVNIDADVFAQYIVDVVNQAFSDERITVPGEALNRNVRNKHNVKPV